MKQIFSIILAVVLVTACNIKKKPTTDEAVKHNDKLIDMLDPYFEVEEEFVDAMIYDSINPSESYNKVLTTIASIKAKYEAEPSFDDEDVLKKAGISYMDALRQAYETEYKRLIEIKTDPDYNDVESARYNDLLDEYNSVYDKAEEKLAKASDDFDKLQKTFATKYNFTINN